MRKVHSGSVDKPGISSRKYPRGSGLASPKKAGKKAKRAKHNAKNAGKGKMGGGY